MAIYTGAVTGATIGSVVPVVGTAAGALLGGTTSIIGGIVSALKPPTQTKPLSQKVAERVAYLKSVQTTEEDYQRLLSTTNADVRKLFPKTLYGNGTAAAAATGSVNSMVLSTAKANTTLDFASGISMNTLFLVGGLVLLLVLLR
jgi:hypothetical protein